MGGSLTGEVVDLVVLDHPLRHCLLLSLGLVRDGVEDGTPLDHCVDVPERVKLKFSVKISGLSV